MDHFGEDGLEEEVERIFLKEDVNNDGVISLQEFLIGRGGSPDAGSTNSG